MKKILIILLILALTACATGPMPVIKDYEPDRPVKSIALLEIDELPEHLALNMSGAPAIFGLFGGIVAADNQKKATATLTEILKNQNLEVGKLLTESLKTSFLEKGYDVQLLKNSREKPGYILTDFNKINTDADLIFDVIFTIAGYVDRGIGKPYKPIVTVRAQGISAETRELVYSSVLNYGYKLGNKWTHIESIDKVEFKDMDAIKASPEVASKALSDSISPLTDELTKNF